MSATRTRARKTPLNWLGKIDPGIYGIALALETAFPNTWPTIWAGSGYRPDSAEHRTGRAVDWIVVERTGHRPNSLEHANALAFIDWLIANMSDQIQHILYSPDGTDRVQSYNPSRGTWKILGNRGSVSANHIDHVHVLFKPGAIWRTDLKLPTRTATASPGVSTAPKPTPTPAPKPGPVISATDAANVARYDLGRKRTTTKNYAVVAGIQRALNKATGTNLTVDGLFGPGTRDAYAAWQRHLGYRGRDADGIPGHASLTRLGTDTGQFRAIR